MKEKYEYCYKTKTRHIDYDMADRLKLSSVLTLLQESAGYGAENMGWGADRLWKKKWGFIITGYYVELYKNVPVGAEITVKTWPMPAKHVIFEREYQFLTEDGELIGAATSRWCLFDVGNQKLLSVSALGVDDPEKYNQEKALNFKQWKILAFETENRTADYTTNVSIANYDRYMHLNNTFYADFCVSCFGVEEWTARQVKSFQILFEKQCFQGDVLKFYKEKISDADYVIVGKKQDGGVVVKAKIQF